MSAEFNYAAVFVLVGMFSFMVLFINFTQVLYQMIRFRYLIFSLALLDRILAVLKMFPLGMLMQFFWIALAHNFVFRPGVLQISGKTPETSVVLVFCMCFDVMQQWKLLNLLRHRDDRREHRWSQFYEEIFRNLHECVIFGSMFLLAWLLYLFASDRLQVTTALVCFCEAMFCNAFFLRK